MTDDQSETIMRQAVVTANAVDAACRETTDDAAVAINALTMVTASILCRTLPVAERAAAVQDVAGVIQMFVEIHTPAEGG